ncbi:MAG: hypothetical protein ACXWXO_20215 [Nocardioides sp.]
MSFRPTIRTQSDLQDAWSQLMGPLGFADHSIWLMLIGPDDRPFPHLTRIEEAESPPSDEGTAGLGALVSMLRDDFVPDGRIAFLRSRPGSAGITRNDRAWAHALYQAGRLAGVPLEVVHRACDVDLVPIPMDDVLAHSA